MKPHEVEIAWNAYLSTISGIGDDQAHVWTWYEYLLKIAIDSLPNPDKK